MNLWRVRLIRGAIRLSLAAAAVVFVASTYVTLEASSVAYVVKWGAFLVLLGNLLVLSRGRISAASAVPFLALTGIAASGVLIQAADAIDLRAVEIAGGYILTACLGLLVAPAALRRPWAHRLIWPPLLVGAAAGLIAGLLLGLTLGSDAWLIDGDRVRYIGYFKRPNSAGWYGVVVFILAGASFLSTRRVWTLVGLPLAVLASVLTDSRGAMTAMATLVAAWAALTLATRVRWRGGSGKVRYVALALGLLALGAWGAGSALGPVTNIQLNDWSSGRWESWRRSLAYVDSPGTVALGMGLSRNRSFVPNGGGAVGGESDNFYVDLFDRTGLLGVALFAVAVVTIGTRLGQRVWRGPAPGDGLRIWAAAAFTSALAYGVVESHLLTSGTLHAAVVWSLAGWAAYSER